MTRRVRMAGGCTGRDSTGQVHVAARVASRGRPRERWRVRQRWRRQVGGRARRSGSTRGQVGRGGGCPRGAEPVGGRRRGGSQERRGASPTCRHVSRTERRTQPRRTRQLQDTCLAAQTVNDFQGHCHVYPDYVCAVVDEQSSFIDGLCASFRPHVRGHLRTYLTTHSALPSRHS